MLPIGGATAVWGRRRSRGVPARLRHDKVRAGVAHRGEGEGRRGHIEPRRGRGTATTGQASEGRGVGSGLESERERGKKLHVGRIKGVGAKIDGAYPWPHHRSREHLVIGDDDTYVSM